MSDSSFGLCGLEKEFANQGCFSLDLSQYCDFPEFLSPNEGNPESIQHHFKNISNRGIVVCTGTERSFYTLLFCSETWCEGLVIRDIQPKVKAYVDCNILLLRISKTREEYANLSECIGKDKLRLDLKQRIELITEKTTQSNLPFSIKEYYLKNMRAICSLYLLEPKPEREEINEMFEACAYNTDDEQFSKLQRYAQSGNIVCITGTINDLSFLKTKNVVAVDTSNISDYILIDIKGGKEDFHPRIIWTCVSPQIKATTYFSYIHTALTDQERVEFDDLLGKLKRAYNCTTEKTLVICCMDKLRFFFWQAHDGLTEDMFDSSIGPFYSKKTLQILRGYIQNFIYVPRIGYLDFNYVRGPNWQEKVNELNEQEIETLCKEGDISRFLPRIVTAWGDVHPAKYIAFIQASKWREAFEKVWRAYPKHYFEQFLKRLQQYGLKNAFIEKFGRRQLAQISFLSE
jgi:hypothetical protein